MQVFNCDSWASRDTYSTETGNFIGVAIGPESDEAEVRIGEVLLQAGRVMPVRSFGGAYTAQRNRIPSSTITAIARLQLLAFECAEELAAYVPRANGSYSASAALTAAGGYQRLITVPFIGRRQARFQIVCAAATVSYRVWGVLYNPASAALKETLIVDSGGVPDANSTLGFYVGGTNEAEAWDALALDIDLPSDQTTRAAVATIGELGV